MLVVEFDSLGGDWRLQRWYTVACSYEQSDLHVVVEKRCKWCLWLGFVECVGGTHSVLDVVGSGGSGENRL